MEVETALVSISADSLFIMGIIIWNVCRWQPGPTLAVSACAYLLCLTVSSSDCVSGLSASSTTTSSLLLLYHSTCKKKKKNLFSIFKQKYGEYLEKSSWPLMLDPATVLATAPGPRWRWDEAIPGHIPLLPRGPSSV